MARKIVSGIMLTLFLLISMLTLAFNIQPVKASGTIYIRADGSIDPPTAPVQRNGDIYTLTGNISSDASGIVIERNNVTLDGTGYTVQGIGSGQGIDLSYRTDIIIQNMNIRNFSNGVYLWYSYGITVLGNNITNNDSSGISLCHSSSNHICQNNIMTNNIEGILLYFLSGSNHIYLNTIVANKRSGIHLISFSDVNNIYGNNITANTKYGVEIDYYSGRNTFYHNNFINNTVSTGSSVNVWDDSYPSGGNYWSDYEDKYPDAEEIDDSGIWDTPYVIDEENEDHYPLLNKHQPLCDVVVIKVEPSKLVVAQGKSTFIEATVQNQGNYPEYFDLFIYADDNLLETRPVKNLLSGVISTITCTWNTTGFDIGNYTISAYATPVPFETNTTNNNYTDGVVTIRSPIHDVAVVNVLCFKTVVCQNYSTFAYVTVENQGDFIETFNITAYANETVIHIITNINLTSEDSKNVTFAWNTTGFAKGNYTIWAYAEPVEGEIDTEDNTVTDGWVVVSILGDVNGDGKVRADDVLAVALRFGTDQGGPPNSNGYIYDANCDINDDLKIRVDDVLTVALNFGQG